MSNQFSSDEEVLARLVREAGDPSVSPDPQYAETLRATILDRVGPAETAAHVTEGIRKADVIPTIILKRTQTMKRIAKFAVAATILVALGILVSWMTIGGGSTNIAFARVADALDSLRSATFDVKSEGKGENGQPPVTATGKGFFLAPSHQRIEVSVDIAHNAAVKAAAEAARRHHVADSPAAKAAGQAAAEAAAKAIALMPEMNQVTITIVDGQTAKSIMLMPNMKIAVAMDMKKLREDSLKKSAKLAKDPPADVFETVRRLVREGSSGTGDKAERLGKKEIDGRQAVGFRVNANGMDMTLWADPETAWPIRIEIVMEMLDGVRLVMNNFRYDVDLDPSLFSLEPPAGYSTQAMNMTIPVEEDLLSTLRTIAEHGKGLFPAKLGMNKEVMELLMAGDKPEMFTPDKLTGEKIEAEMNKVAAKYGGKDKLRAKYGKDIPPAIMAEITKAVMPLMQKQIQEQTQKGMPLMQERMRGITFYTMLKPENDAHYVGAGVKLGTPDRPILWYKPTGADKYRVIYADLSVKDRTPDDVKKLPKAKAK
jgi:outer membrane lipoprotein-sorting protein